VGHFPDQRSRVPYRVQLKDMLSSAILVEVMCQAVQMLDEVIELGSFDVPAGVGLGNLLDCRQRIAVCWVAEVRFVYLLEKLAGVAE
jgi:hypothetical protein